MLKLLDNKTNVGWMVRVTIYRIDNPEQSYSTSEIGHAFAHNKFQVFHTALTSVASVPYKQPKPTDKAARGCPIESVIRTPIPQRQFFFFKKRSIKKTSVFTLTAWPAFLWHNLDGQRLREKSERLRVTQTRSCYSINTNYTLCTLITFIPLHTELCKHRVWNPSYPSPP